MTIAPGALVSFGETVKGKHKMDDYQFEILKIKAAVCPAKDDWPADDTQVSILGDKPTIKGSALYWSALHSCVDDARERVTGRSPRWLQSMMTRT
jgi:hypothetical protein